MENGTLLQCSYYFHVMAIILG